MGLFAINKSVADLIHDLADDRKRATALAELGKMGTAIIPDLTRVLGDQRRQAYAAVLLADIGEPAIPALIGALDENKGGEYARGALERIARPDMIIPLLIVALGDKEKQAHACGMLNDYGMPTLGPYLPQLADALGDTDKQVFASNALVNVGSAATPHLLRAVSDEKRRFWAAFTLNKIDPLTYPERWLNQMASGVSGQVGGPASSHESAPYCPYCGNPMKGDYTYCAACGKKAERIAPQTASTISISGTIPPTGKNKPIPNLTPGQVPDLAYESNEYVVGGFSSADMARPGSLGYGIYITSRRVIGVKKPGLFTKAVGATVAGTVMGAVLGFGAKWTVKSTLGRNLSADENRALLAELEKNKDLELSNQDITLIQLKEKFFTNPGQLAFFLRGAQKTDAVISLANDEVVNDLKALFKEHFPGVLKVVN